MSKNEKKLSSKFCKFDNMSTEDLKEIIKLNMALADEEEDALEDTIYITEILLKREIMLDIDVDSAWSTFKDKYCLYKNYKPLWDLNETENVNGNINININPNALIWRRFASFAAVLLIFLFAGSVTAFAFGYNPLGLLAKWTDDLFWFESEVLNNSPTEELAETLQEQGFDVDILPSWLPEEYIFNKLEIFESETETKIFVSYIKTTDNITELFFDIKCKTFDNKPVYEKNAGDILLYEHNNVDYHIIGNMENLCIVWRKDNYDCSINGKITIEEAKKIIDSIMGE